MKERKEVNEVKEVKEKSGRVAAFFDLDGTLVALPSLERRLFRTLRYRREIRTKNYFSWLLESLRLMPRGINAILQGNKMYLRGVQILDERGEGDGEVSEMERSPSGTKTATRPRDRRRLLRGAIHDCLSPPFSLQRSRRWHGMRSRGTRSC